MLEKIGENQASRQVRTAVDEELSGFFATHTAGDRLEAGLAADQHWRGVQVEKLRRGLRRVHLFEAAARNGCVCAGLVAAALVVSTALAWSDQAGVLASMSAVSALVLVAALTVSGLMALGAAGWRWRLLKGAQRDALAVPAEVTPVYQVVNTDDPEERERVRRSNRVQSELVWVYRDERTMGDVCLWAGYASVASWLLLVAVWILETVVSSSWFLPMLLGLMLWFPFLIALIGASLACVYHGSQRKRLLRRAAAEGLAVRDPAACPWE